MAEIRWLGHTCFRIKGKEAVVLTDPVDRSTGYGIGKHSADIVTISGDPMGQNLSAIRPEYQTVSGPGEYEMHEVFITGARTFQDNQKGAVNGHNTTYVIEIEGMKIGHLGNIGHSLTEREAEPLSEIDILLTPVGGETGLTYEQAAELVTVLDPKIVIPMRFATESGDRSLGDVHAFLKKLGIDQVETVDKLVIKSSELTDTTRIVVLNPDSDPVKR